MLRTITKQLLRPHHQMAAVQRLVSSDVENPEPERKPRLIPVYTGERGVNIVTLVGRVGQGPEMRGSEENPVTVLSLATSQSFKTEEGAYQQYTDWHKIAIFHRVLASYIGRTVKKGDKLFVRGSIRYKKVTNKDGLEFTRAEIKADDVMNLTPRSNIPTPNASTELDSDSD